MPKIHDIDAKGTTKLDSLTFPASAVGYLYCDADGILSWDAAATPEAAGLDKQVQFNDGGTMGANAGLTFDKTTRKLSGLEQMDISFTGAYGYGGNGVLNLYNTTSGNTIPYPALYSSVYIDTTLSTSPIFLGPTTFDVTVEGSEIIGDIQAVEIDVTSSVAFDTECGIIGLGLRMHPYDSADYVYGIMARIDPEDSVADLRGIWVRQNAGAGSSVTNAYGIYIDDFSTIPGGGNNFNLYSAGANSKNFLEGYLWSGSSAGNHNHIHGPGRISVIESNGDLWTLSAIGWFGGACAVYSLSWSDTQSSFATVNHAINTLDNQGATGSINRASLLNCNNSTGRGSMTNVEVNAWGVSSTGNMISVEMVDITAVALNSVEQISYVYGIEMFNSSPAFRALGTGSISVDQFRAINIHTPTIFGSVTIGDVYGIYIDDLSSLSPTGSCYNLYSAGATSQNVFEGQLLSRGGKSLYDTFIGLASYCHPGQAVFAALGTGDQLTNLSNLFSGFAVSIHQSDYVANYGAVIGYDARLVYDNDRVDVVPGYFIGFQSILDVKQSASADGYVTGIFLAPSAVAAAYAEIKNMTVIGSDADIALVAINGDVTGTAYGYKARVVIADGGGANTVTGSGYGFYVVSPVLDKTNIGSSISMVAGLYIEDQYSALATNSYNIYSAGASSKNFFQGLTQVGYTTAGHDLTDTNTRFSVLQSGGTGDPSDAQYFVNPIGQYVAINGYVNNNLDAITTAGNFRAVSGNTGGLGNSAYGIFGGGYQIGSISADAYGGFLTGTISDDLGNANGTAYGATAAANQVAWHGNTVSGSVIGLQVSTGSVEASGTCNVSIRGIDIQSPTIVVSLGTVTDVHGLYINDMGTYGSGINANIYSAGATSRNVFEGSGKIKNSATIYKMEDGSDGDTQWWAAGDDLYSPSAGSYGLLLGTYVDATIGSVLHNLYAFGKIETNGATSPPNYTPFNRIYTSVESGDMLHPPYETFRDIIGLEVGTDYIPGGDNNTNLKAVARYFGLGNTPYTNSKNVEIYTDFGYGVYARSTTHGTFKALSIGYHPTNTATITNAYSLYIEDISSIVTGNCYNIYSAGLTSQNVFEGTIRSYRSANDAAANLLEFRKTRGSSAGQIGDEIGTITFWSNNSTPSLVEYANLTAKIADETDGEECGIITYSAMISGGGYEGNLPMVYTKGTAGDLTDAFEGMIVINTNDNTLKMYAEGAWRQLATW